MTTKGEKAITVTHSNDCIIIKCHPSWNISLLRKTLQENVVRPMLSGESLKVIIDMVDVFKEAPDKQTLLPIIQMLDSTYGVKDIDILTGKPKIASDLFDNIETNNELLIRFSNNVKGC